MIAVQEKLQGRHSQKSEDNGELHLHAEIVWKVEQINGATCDFLNVNPPQSDTEFSDAGAQTIASCDDSVSVLGKVDWMRNSSLFSDDELLVKAAWLPSLAGSLSLPISWNPACLTWPTFSTGWLPFLAC